MGLAAKLIQNIAIDALFCNSLTIFFIGHFPDWNVPQFIKYVIVYDRHFDVKVIPQKVGHHLLERLEVRQVFLAERISRPKKLFVRIAFDETSTSFHENLQPI